MLSISIQQWILYFILGIDAFIGLFVLIRNPRRLVNAAFFIFTLGTVIWGGAILLLYTTHNFFFSQFTFIGVGLLTAGFILFTKVFPKEKKLDKLFYFFVSLPIFVIITAPFNLFITGLMVHPSGYVEPINSPIIPIFVLILVASFTSGIYFLIQNYLRSDPLEKLKAKYFITGIIIFLLSLAIFNTILPALGIFDLNLLGAASSIVFIGITAYAIVRHQLMDIRIVIQRGLLYLVTLSFGTVLYFTSVFILGDLFRKAVQITPFLSAVITSLAFVIGFPYFKNYFQETTDRLFFKGEYNYYEVLKELSQALNSTIDFRKLLVAIEKVLKKNLKVEKIFLLLKNREFQKRLNHFSDYGSIEGYYRIMDNVEYFPHEIIQVGSGFLEQLPDESRGFIKSFFEKAGFGVIVPIFSQEAVVSLLFLGPKRSQDPFFAKDIELLNILSHQAGTAFENARLYDEVKEYGLKLEKKVDERTKELRDLYESQSQFLADISHELQTPLSIMKGNFGLFKKDLEGQRMRGRILGSLDEAVDRVSRMVNDLLSLAKADFAKNAYQKEALRLDDLLQEVYDDSAVLAESKSIKFSYTIQNAPTLVSGDRKRLKEMLLNILSNAFKFTPSNGKVIVVLEKEGNEAKISISDTGIGISSEDLPHIFERFYQSRNQKLKGAGTGLGLAICKKIAEGHDGYISVESVEGKGSKFVVSIPILLQP